jgi:hypothetical protein
MVHSSCGFVVDVLILSEKLQTGLMVLRSYAEIASLAEMPYVNAMTKVPRDDHWGPHWWATQARGAAFHPLREVWGLGRYAGFRYGA